MTWAALKLGKPKLWGAQPCTQQRHVPSPAVSFSPLLHLTDLPREHRVHPLLPQSSREEEPTFGLFCTDLLLQQLLGGPGVVSRSSEGGPCS